MSFFVTNLSTKIRRNCRLQNRKDICMRVCIHTRDVQSVDEREEEDIDDGGMEKPNTTPSLIEKTTAASNGSTFMVGINWC